MNHQPDLSQTIPANPPFRRSTGSAGVTVKQLPRQLNMISVTEDELENLYMSGNLKTLHFGLFSLSIGILVAVAGTLLTVEITSPLIFAGYVAALCVSVLASLCFGILALMNWQSAVRRLADIKGMGGATSKA